MPPTAPSTTTASQPGPIVERSVVFDVTRQPPATGDAFLVSHVTEEGPSIELWSTDGLAASLRLEPCVDEHRDCRSDALAYDGRWIWVWFDRRYQSNYQTPIDEDAMLVRADAQTGETQTVWSSADGDHVFDVVPTGDGGATLVIGPGTGGSQLRLAIQLLDAAGAIEEIASFPIAAADVVSAVLDSELDRLAYTRPGSSTSQLRVIDIATAADTVLEFDRDVWWLPWMIALEWSSDGQNLLVEDIWEHGAYFVIQPDAPDPATSMRRFGNTGGCSFDDGQLAVAFWRLPYGESESEPGTVKLLSSELDVVADYGLDLYAGQLVCLSDHRIVLARHPVVSNTMTTLTVVGSNGAIELATGEYAVLHARIPD